MADESHLTTSTFANPAYVFRPGQLGDSLVALPAVHAIKKAIGARPLILISDRVPGEEVVPSWDVFRTSGLFSKALFYTAINRSFISSMGGLASVAREIRRLGKGPLFYFASSGASTSMVRRHRIFFEKFCKLEMIGREEAFKPCMRWDEAGHLINCVPEHQRLLRLVQEHFRAAKTVGIHELLPQCSGAKKSIDRYWEQIRSGRGAVALGPGSKMSCKRWPIERFEMVGKFLVQQKGLFPIIFGGGQDRETGNFLLKKWEGIGLNLCGISIAEAAEAMRRCVFYLGNDTGTMHLAATVGLSCVAIFSARDAPGRWHPVGNGHVILRERVPCEGCTLTVCNKQVTECLDRISAEKVIAAIEQLLLKDGAPRISR